MKQLWIKTIPSMFGLFFMSFAFGMLLDQVGYGPLYALIIPLLIYSGSLQFVLLGYLSNSGQILALGILAFSMNIRHIFYGFSFLGLYDVKGWKKLYLIYTLCDETFALINQDLHLYEAMEDNEKRDHLFIISMLNQVYCVVGALAGNLIGGLLPLDISGIEFSITAMFFVIIMQQWREKKKEIMVGGLAGILSFFLFADQVMVIASILLSALLLLLLDHQGYMGAHHHAEGGNQTTKENLS